MKKGFIFLLIVFLAVFFFLPSKDATWQAKEGSMLVYEVSRKAKETAKGMSDRIDQLNMLGTPRIFTYGENRVVVQIPSLQDDLKNQIKQYLLATSLELRLVASPSVGFGVDEREEWQIYQKEKKEGNLNTYTLRLHEKGYAWFPSGDKKGQERLLWIRDSYNINQESFSKVSYDEKWSALSVVMKPEPAKDLAQLTRTYKNECFAIVYNNTIFATPVITDPIPDGRVMLNGFSKQESMMLQHMSGIISLPSETQFLEEIKIDSLQGKQQKHGFFTYVFLKKGTKIPKDTSFEIRKIKNFEDASKSKYIVIGGLTNPDFIKKHNELNSTANTIKQKESKLKILEKQGIRLLEQKFKLKRLINEARNEEDKKFIQEELLENEKELDKKTPEITSSEKELAQEQQKYADLLKNLTETYRKDFEKNVRAELPDAIEEGSFSTVNFVQNTN